MCTVTLNNVAGCQGVHQNSEGLELLLSTRKSLSCILFSNLSCLFQYCPYMLLVWEFVWTGKLFKIHCVGQEDVPVFVLPVDIGPLSWGDMFILTEQQKKDLQLGVFPILSDLICDMILLAFPFTSSQINVRSLSMLN